MMEGNGCQGALIDVTSNDSENKQLKIVEEASDFASREIRPFASEFEEQQGISRSLINKLAERGYLAACFPREYGGLGLDPLHYGLFTEVIGKACSSTRAMLTVHTSLVGETLIRWGNTLLKERFLPAMAKGKMLASFALTEPEVGSNARGVKTSYKFQGGHYLISGRKKWITLAGIADLFLVVASEGDNITAFLVERNTPGISVSPMKGLLASRAAYVSDVVFDNVQVPEENVLGREGNGFTYVVNTALDYGRYSIAWGALGIAQEALEAMVSYSRRRKQFGKGLHSFQLIKGMIGDSISKVAAGRALCMNAGELRRKKNADAVMETTIAKYYMSRAANQIASDAVQIHGGNGCSSNYSVERLFREAKVLEIIEGTSQILQEVIADYGLSKFYFPDGMTADRLK